jgi:hypothetical protein
VEYKTAKVEKDTTKLGYLSYPKTIAMATEAHSPLLREISGVALFISLPQLIASPVITGLTHIIHKDNTALDVKEILDFLVISFPLTLSIAVLTVLVQKGQFNLFSLLVAVAGAALLSNLLHQLIGQIPSVDLKRSFNESFSYTENKYGNSAAINWVVKIFGIYWKSFGPILFIQSCCIGIYAGYRYYTIEKNKAAKQKLKG